MNTFENHKNYDEEYADWCLTNNWLKLDDQAGIYVCGEDVWDKEWKQWIKEHMAKNRCAYCGGKLDCKAAGIVLCM